MTTTEQPRARTRTSAGAVVAFGYGLVCYASFVVLFLYAVAFVADVVVPRTVDRGGPATGVMPALLIDVALLGVFAVQHSVMARPGFKRRWTTVVSRHVERSTYVLATDAALALLFWQWRPIPAVVWDVPSPPARLLMGILIVAGFVWVLAMSFAIDHFDLFGLRQVAQHLRRLPVRAPVFAHPWPYRLVRHPMMLGFFPAFLAAPTMTWGHLLFGVLGCGYVLVGVRLEERDLSKELPEYAAYAAVTPRLLPRPTRR
jgi:protein-S-isoprenylcysteine O-methyltransferase Ste14